MALSCDLKDIAQAAAGCEEQLSGLGNMVYVAYPEDLQATPTYEENSAAFASTSFKFAEGKGAWKIRCKKQSVQLTATGNAVGTAYSHRERGTERVQRAIGFRHRP